MPVNGQDVKFNYYTRAKFNALSSKDNNTIYYVGETDGEIKQYLGSKLVSGGVSSASLAALTSLKSNTDNRTVQTTPNDYNGLFKIQGLKTNSAIGITGGGSYSALLGIRGWRDSSGGNSHELAFGGNGEIYHRHGVTTSWGAWDILATRDWVTSNTSSGGLEVLRTRGKTSSLTGVGSGDTSGSVTLTKPLVGGDRLLIEVGDYNGRAYNKEIVGVTVGRNSTSPNSTDDDTIVGTFTTFNGTKLQIYSFSISYSGRTLYFGSKKTIQGNFTSGSIEWTTDTFALQVGQIWRLNDN